MSGFEAESLLLPHVRGLEPYVPILPFEALSRKLGRPPAELVKLDANENPWGPLPDVREALARYPYYHIYPDPQQTELREALAAHLLLPAAQILPTHGADELLDLLCRLLLAPGHRVINCPPTFGMYEFDAALAHAQVLSVQRRADFSVDVEAIMACARFGEEAGEVTPRILFLTSPNNPTGNWLDEADLRRLLQLPLLVVLDEAYVEFADHASRAAWVLEHDNLVVVRTFSKAAGIAGLRLGYAVCPPWLMAALWTFKQPYNVNVAATVAGLASLAAAPEISAVVERMKGERARLLQGLAQLPALRPWPSQANFVLCDVVQGEARALHAELEARGILVRYYNKPGLRNCIRISVGRPEQTDALLAALEEIQR